MRAHAAEHMGAHVVDQIENADVSCAFLRTLFLCGRCGEVKSAVPHV